MQCMQCMLWAGAPSTVKTHCSPSPKGMACHKVSLTIYSMDASLVLRFLVTVCTMRRIFRFNPVTSLLFRPSVSPFQINTGFNFTTRPNLIHGWLSSSVPCSNLTANCKKAVMLFLRRPLMRTTTRWADLSSKHFLESGSNDTWVSSPLAIHWTFFVRMARCRTTQYLQ